MAVAAVLDSSGIEYLVNDGDVQKLGEAQEEQTWISEIDVA